MSEQNQQLVTFTKPGELMKFLEQGKSAIACALPKHLNADRMLRLAVTCFSTTPKLRQCTGISILSSVVVASQLGLEPGIAGQAYLIPYKTTCTLVPGWQGLVGLLNNSGRATAWTGTVFEGDVWDFQLGSNPRCIHIPGDNFGDPDKIQWVYACGKVNGSEQPVIEAWPMSRVWKHRDRFNKVGNAHYSYTHPEMYARKVVLLQVLKYMPRSIELQNAITAASAADIGNTSVVKDGIVIEEEIPVAGKPVFESKTIEEGGEGEPQPAKETVRKATPLEGITNLCKGAGVTLDGLMAHLRGTGKLGASEELPMVSDKRQKELIAAWPDILTAMKQPQEEEEREREPGDEG